MLNLLRLVAVGVGLTLSSACDSGGPPDFVLKIDADGSVSVVSDGCSDKPVAFDSIAIEDFPVDADGRWTGEGPTTLLKLPSGTLIGDEPVLVDGVTVTADAQILIRGTGTDVGILGISLPPLEGGQYRPTELAEASGGYIGVQGATASLDALRAQRECG